MVHSKALRARLTSWLAERLEGVDVELGMTYGQPSTKPAVSKLVPKGCDRIVCLPLYPQYSGSTTGSVLDKVFSSLGARRHIPAMRTVTTYASHPAYISALAVSDRETWTSHRPDVLLLSFHGVPKSCVDASAPYDGQCMETVGLLREALGLDARSCQASFQSRFGHQEWLSPSTEESLIRLGREGVGAVDVACPGFAADCLEVLEELALEGKETFLEHGGRSFLAIPCLNERADHVAALGGLFSAESGALTLA